MRMVAFRELTVSALLALTGAAGGFTGREGPSTPDAASIDIAVSGVERSAGRVVVAICTPDSFTRETCPFRASAPATRGTTQVTVAGVPPGTYAAQAYWDANGNGKADRNFAGLPTELVGFSRNHKVGMSRPRFEGSAFTHSAKGSALAITLRTIP